MLCVTYDNVLKNIQIKTCYGWDIGIAIDTADSKVRLFDINISAKSKAYCIRKCCSMTIRDTGGTWVILIKKNWLRRRYRRHFFICESKPYAKIPGYNSRAVCILVLATGSLHIFKKIVLK